MDPGRPGLRETTTRPALRRVEKPPPRSPLVGLAAAFASGCVISIVLNPPPAVAFGLLAAAGLCLALWGRTSRKAALLLALLAALAAGAGLHGQAARRLLVQRARLEAQTGPLELTLLVDGAVERDHRRQRVFVEVHRAPAALRDLVGARLSLGLYEEGAPEVRPGDLLHGRFRLDQVRPAGNPLVPDYGDYLSARGVAGWARDSGPVVIVGQAVSPLHALLRLREYLSRVALEPLAEDSRPLARALLLGDRSGLPPDDLEAYRRSGVFHVFAVSGLHVGLVGYLFFALGGALRLKRNSRYLLSLAAIIAFALLTGARPPALRALLMAGIFLGGRLLGRPAHLLTSVCAAALILLLINPLQLLDISFQLSFTAALGIALLTPRLAAWLGRRRVPTLLAEPLSATLGAQLALFPLLALHFARVPLLGIALNLVAVPLLGVILLLGLPYLLLAALWSGGAPLLGTPLALFLRLLDRLLGGMANTLPLTVEVRQPDWLLVAVSFLLLGLALRALCATGKFRRLSLSAPLIALLLLWGWHLLRDDTPEALRLTFFDVNRGDCVLIESPRGDVVLVDGGADWAVPAAEHLRRRGVRRLDAVILTHADEEHYADLLPILKDFSVERIYRPADPGAAESWGAYLEAESASDATVIHPARGSRLESRDPALELLVLSSSDAPRPELDTADASLVLLLSYGDFEILLAGAIGRAGGRELLDHWSHGSVDVLKVPRHGAADGTSAELLRALRPGHAVVFSGGALDYRTRWRLAAHGCWLYDTRQRGAAVLETDGRGFSLGRFDNTFTPAVYLYSR